MAVPGLCLMPPSPPGWALDPGVAPGTWVAEGGLWVEACSLLLSSRLSLLPPLSHSAPGASTAPPVTVP